LIVFVEGREGEREREWDVTGKTLVRALAKVDFPDPGGPTRRRTF